MTIRYPHRTWLRFAVDPSTLQPGGVLPPAPAAAPPANPAPQAPAGGQPPAPADDKAPAEQPPADPAEGGKKPNDERVVADLARERKRRQALEEQMSGFTEAIKRLAGEPDGEAQGTELERLTSRMAALEQQAEASRVDALRMQIVAETGVPANLAEFLTGSDEQTLRQQAQKLVAATAAAGGPQRPAPDPAQGAKPSADQLTEIDAKIAEALAAGDVRTSIALKRHRAALASTR